jgi:plastocyanin
MHVKSSVALAAAGLIFAAVPAYAAGNSVSQTAAAPAYRAGNSVSVGDDYYSPRVKAVNRGTRVVWVNNGNSSHTVTTRAWSRTLSPGERYGRVVRRGFRYHCRFHDGQTGRIAIG